MSTGTDRIEATVTGVVQGVGFRPFVARTATDLDLAGWVRNRGDAGVSIVLEGPPSTIEAFLHRLRTDPPPLAEIESISTESAAPQGRDSFEIRDSTGGDGATGTLPPDTGICESCLADVRDPDSRYHDYWATSCVDCGPRYTVIRDLPYDRPRTAMDDFPMCADCEREYEDPGDRRYHAQTIACPDCGPTLFFEPEPGHRPVSENPAIERTIEELRSGGIVAIKGIGGTHLACLATDTGAVNRLRERSGRPAKPFALMAPSLDRIEEFARISATERTELESVRRPIVLLEKRDRPWLNSIAPNLHTVGVMLPYAGLHHLLFDGIDDPLVVTSANHPGQPMATTVQAIWEDLGGVIDGALVHDREIVARTDDSVRRVVDGTPRFVRRSRGWVPQPLPRFAEDSAPDVPTVLAVGAEFDATVALTRGGEVVPSQHVGDVDGPETRSFHRKAVSHLGDLLGVEPDVIACDAHPGFVTTAEAERRATEDGLTGPVRVQHHHAHAASLLGEHRLDRGVVIVADGTGYGPDGSVWGGEVLDATRADYDRVGGLSPFSLPGGEAAVTRPARILASLIGDPDRVDSLLVSRGAVEDRSAAALIREQIERGVNSPETTSAGRFLDAISALLGAVTERSYEGEPAMVLEALASRGTPIDLELPIALDGGRQVLDVKRLARQLADFTETRARADVAATAQQALAEGLATIAVDVANEAGVDRVGFSGGVAYNDAISRTIREQVERAGLHYLEHEGVPPGDAGIAYGQAIVATARSRESGSAGADLESASRRR
ncbi:MAG: carbamoyltransferase HypF [Halodesulfurarchaeum sp.]